MTDVDRLESDVPWAEPPPQPPPPGVTGRLREALPRQLTAPTRRAGWWRVRARRWLSALVAAIAAWLALATIAPPRDAPGQPVLVAARELAVGHRLTAADLEVQRRPADYRPDAALTAVDEAVGRVLAGPCLAGEVITPGRLHGTSVLDGLPAGQVAVALPVADVGVLSAVQPGDHVRAYSAASGEPVVTRALVVAVTAATEASSALTSAPTPRLLVALDERQAAAVAAETVNAVTGATGFVVAALPTTG